MECNRFFVTGSISGQDVPAPHVPHSLTLT